MGTIYALLVGINDYPQQMATPLTGCVNDTREAGRLLADRAGETADVRVLLNADATTAAVTEAIERHLGAAGPGDTALFWFSGHGTQSRATGADLLVEATGRNQALVCVDGPLPDKRLGALLDAVATRGAHTAAVLDCCYAGGATRDSELTARYAPPGADWDWDSGSGSESESDFAGAEGAGARDAVVPEGAARHVLLAASRLNQRSYEGYFAGRRQGAFTHALLGAVRDAGREATYRELLSAADARLQRSGGGQQPVLHPAEPGGVADLPFLGGSVSRAPSPYLLRYGTEGWEVDCGSGHGLREGAEGAGTEFTVLPSAGDGGVVRARAVHGHRTLVDPVDWAPVAARVYPVALSALALAPATVAVAGADAGRALRETLAVSPLLRVVESPMEAGDLHFRVEVRGTAAHVLRRDGSPFVEPLPLPLVDAGRVADCLVHLTRWHQLRDLTSRPSLLDGLVRVEIKPWDARNEPGAELLPDGGGEIVCPYVPGPGGPESPWVSIRLHNRSPDRPLWCMLLDLTDGYRSDAELYPGHFIAPGHTGYALDDQPVRLSLPVGREAVGGASARDWLKLVVAEGELNTVPFHLPAWGAGASSRSGGLVSGDGVLRFSGPQEPGFSRDLGRVGGASTPGLWATRTIPLRTVVPG
ncbi:caspase domain-containing protein [Streptomyces sp. NPDC056486]|uniref:caspase family protein n=1 Tax=Streptomyces sp. NPDC056486 TaxID=3345835 RepID=UPI0036838F02